MTPKFPLNARAAALLQFSQEKMQMLRIARHQLKCGAEVYDFGIDALGGLQAGLLLARICLSDLAGVMLGPPHSSWNGSYWSTVSVTTDQPIAACMASQYAGWPIKAKDYFAMGSGPMRCVRGKEKLLLELGYEADNAVVVGVLEADSMPTCDIAEQIAEECRVNVAQIKLCVAPTRSIAGTTQIVARSVETAMHKLHEVGGDLKSIVSATGYAPLPPPAAEFAQALGRTNDAILYGGAVTLWVSGEPDLLDLIDKVPSSTSKDWGQPFAQTFANYNYDFYRVDPGLFAPAVITMIDLKSGKSRQAGTLNLDCLRQSFGD